jgi:hypothetical protein
LKLSNYTEIDIDDDLEEMIAEKSAQVSIITNFPHEFDFYPGRLIAVSSKFICYAVKGRVFLML